jgi:hypothetical protein
MVIVVIRVYILVIHGAVTVMTLVGIKVGPVSVPVSGKSYFADRCQFSLLTLMSSVQSHFSADNANRVLSAYISQKYKCFREHLNLLMAHK